MFHFIFFVLIIIAIFFYWRDALAVVIVIVLAVWLASGTAALQTIKGPIGSNGCTWFEESTGEVWGFEHCTAEQMRAIMADAAKRYDLAPPPPKNLAKGSPW